MANRRAGPISTGSIASSISATPTARITAQPTSRAFPEGLALFAADHPDRAANIQPLFVSIDPVRDTPERLREFTDAFDPDLIGLTGTREQLEAAAKNFFVQFARGEEQENGAYLMDHSTVTYLFAPDSQPIATLPTELGPEAVAAELDKWVA